MKTIGSDKNRVGFERTKRNLILNLELDPITTRMLVVAAIIGIALTFNYFY